VSSGDVGGGGGDSMSSISINEETFSFISFSTKLNFEHADF
jgi:hypothetical protein